MQEVGLESTWLVEYEIDDYDVIAAVGGAWTTFAQSNDGGHLMPESVIGVRLWDFISDPTTVSIYQAIVAKVRAHGDSLSFRFRCDSPGNMRVLGMHISSLPSGNVRFSVSPSLVVPRARIALLDPAALRSSTLLRMCSWCKNIADTHDNWMPIEEAMDAYMLLDGTALPNLTHGICPACLKVSMAVLDDIEQVAPLARSFGGVGA